MADSEERLTTRKHYGHAVLNGAAIGLSYHVSPAVSAVVTAALLAHEFSDSADAARQGLRERQDRRGLREYLISSLCVTAGPRPNVLSRYGGRRARLGVALALFGGYFHLSQRERSHPGKPPSASSIIDRCADVWRRGGDVSRECPGQMIRVASQETHTSWQS